MATNGTEHKKYVVILKGIYAIGPFDRLEDALRYQTSDKERDNMRIMEVVQPDPEGRK